MCALASRHKVSFILLHMANLEVKYVPWMTEGERDVGTLARVN